MIDGICERYQRQVDWRSNLPGGVMQHTGSEPLMTRPLKGDYSIRNLARPAWAQGAPLGFPDLCPFLSVVPARAFYRLKDCNKAGGNALSTCLSASYPRGLTSIFILGK